MIRVQSIVADSLAKSQDQENMDIVTEAIAPTERHMICQSACPLTVRYGFYLPD